jgi:hypothetical protein
MKRWQQRRNCAKQRTKQEPRQAGSIIVLVEKSVVLAMVEQMEAEAVQQEAVLAHPEGSALLLSTWIEAIDGWLRTAAAGAVPFEQLCQDLGMPQIEVWLGVLLGGFELKSQGEFYSGLLWVRRLSSDGMDTTGAIAPQTLLGLLTLTDTAHYASATWGRETFPNASL